MTGRKHKERTEVVNNEGRAAVKANQGTSSKRRRGIMKDGRSVALRKLKKRTGFFLGMKEKV